MKAEQIPSRLTIIAPAGKDSASRARVICRCECGSEREYDRWSVTREKIKSCGCLLTEVMVARNTTHGLRRTREYHVWFSMIQRCRNPNNKSFEYYGGRGIKVCDRWLGEGGFANFIADMGEPPTPKHQIDRENTDGDYDPANCRWVTKIKQMRNKRDNRMLTFNEETKTIAEWAESTGLSRHCITFRIDRRGWSVEKALTTPNLGRRKPKTA